MKTKKINVLDNQRKYLHDTLSTGERRPAGYVEIYEKKSGELLTRSENMIITSHKPVQEKPNLITYSGRHWLMQRAFWQDQSAENTKDSFISWIGVGHGGAESTSPLIPNTVESYEQNLTAPSAIGYTSEYLHFAEFDKDVQSQGYWKSLASSITFHEDANNLDNIGVAQYLIGKVTATISVDEANEPGEALTGNPNNWLNEAALFVSPSTTASAVTDYTTCKMFAKVKFSTIVKTFEREIVFIWSIYF